MNFIVLSKKKGEVVADDSKNAIQKYSSDMNHFLLPCRFFQKYAQSGLFEKSLIDYSKQFCNKNKLFLDIGAHSGTYSVNLAAYCRKVYAFEPQKMTYYALCGSVALSGIQNVECIQCALGSHDQVGDDVELFIDSTDGGTSSVVGGKGGGVVEKIVLKTLDSFHLGTQVGFIKIDVEGNEYDALCGGFETLKSSGFPPILFECNYPDGDARRLELFCFLFNLSYKIHPLTSHCKNMFLASLD